MAEEGLHLAQVSGEFVIADCGGAAHVVRDEFARDAEGEAEGPSSARSWRALTVLPLILGAHFGLVRLRVCVMNGWGLRMSNRAKSPATSAVTGMATRAPFFVVKRRVPRAGSYSAGEIGRLCLSGLRGLHRVR